MAKCEVIDLTLSDSGDFIQAEKAKVEPKSLSPRYRYVYLTGLVHVRSYVLQSSEVRQTHLHQEKLGVLLRDDEGEMMYWLQWKDVSRSV